MISTYAALSALSLLTAGTAFGFEFRVGQTTPFGQITALEEISSQTHTVTVTGNRVGAVRWFGRLMLAIPDVVNRISWVGAAEELREVPFDASGRPGAQHAALAFVMDAARGNWQEIPAIEDLFGTLTARDTLTFEVTSDVGLAGLRRSWGTVYENVTHQICEVAKIQTTAVRLVAVSNPRFERFVGLVGEQHLQRSAMPKATQGMLVDRMEDCDALLAQHFGAR